MIMSINIKNINTQVNSSTLNFYLFNNKVDLYAISEINAYFIFRIYFIYYF